MEYQDTANFGIKAFSKFVPLSCNPIEAALGSHFVDTLLWQHPDGEKRGGGLSIYLLSISRAKVRF